MRISGNLTWNRTEQAILSKLNLESGGAVQTALDAAIVKDCAKYTPFDSGTLAQTVSGIGSGLITYNVPYAHYMYYGMVYGPNIPMFDGAGNLTGFFSRKGVTKHPTGKELKYNKEKNALAGSFWFERAKADRSEEWLNVAKEAAHVRH